MDYRELLEKYNLLLKENRRLLEENERLKLKFEITKPKPPEKRIVESITEKSTPDDEPTDRTSYSDVNNTSDSISKIKLFMSLFKGRDDVYAKKWENKKKATSGYSPVCLNQWKVGLCGKPKTPCSKCAYQLSGSNDAELLEDYPDFPKGPCVLVLQQDENDKPIHVVWGIPKGTMSPAVLVTAYRPDPARWTDDFRRRKK